MRDCSQKNAEPQKNFNEIEAGNSNADKYKRLSGQHSGQYSNPKNSLNKIKAEDDDPDNQMIRPSR